MKVKKEIKHPPLSLPPQSIEAETALIGSILLNNKTFEYVSDLLNPLDFYKLEHQIIFKAISELINSSKAVDVVTVIDYLKSRSEDNKVGGLGYLNSLAQFVPSMLNIKKYAELIKEKSLLRSIISAGDEIVSYGFQSMGLSAQTVLEQAQEKILSIGESAQSQTNGPKMLHDQMIEFIDHLQNLSDDTTQIKGSFSGFSELDAMTHGFQAGDLVVIAGRPSMGKTAIGLNITQHVAITQKMPVLIISLEMSASQLTQRLVGSIGRVDQSVFKTGKLSQNEWVRVAETLNLVKDTIIDIQDSGINTLSSVRSVVRKWGRRQKIRGLILIDYLQLMSAEDHSARSSPENRATELAQISRGLKLLAKEMQCPIIALSQINRSVESRTDKRPLMSDLRESGAIEQDADAILFIYRDEYYTKDDCKEPGIAEIIVAKQRNGPTGTIKLTWTPDFTLFKDRG